MSIRVAAPASLNSAEGLSEHGARVKPSAYYLWWLPRGLGGRLVADSSSLKTRRRVLAELLRRAISSMCSSQWTMRLMEALAGSEQPRTVHLGERSAGTALSSIERTYASLK